MSSDSIGTQSVQIKPKSRKPSLPPEVAALGLTIKPIGPCVYFLLKGEEVVYVGSTRYGTKRIGMHFGLIDKDLEAALERFRIEWPLILEGKHMATV
jgi:hypothetical protein